MRRVLKRIAVGVGLAVLLTASAAVAAAPDGPRLALVKLGQKPTRLQLVTISPGGGDVVRLAGGGLDSRLLVEFFSPISWSPDGERVAFTGIVGFGAGDDHTPIQRLFTVKANGSDRRAVAATNGASGPLFGPDGHTVAFTRELDRETPTTVGGKQWKRGFHGASVWTVDLLTGSQRQLTPWRDGLYYAASSFSPDGSTLLATREDVRRLSDPEPVALELAGGMALISLAQT